MATYIDCGSKDGSDRWHFNVIEMTLDKKNELCASCVMSREIEWI